MSNSARQPPVPTYRRLLLACVALGLGVTVTVAVSRGAGIEPASLRLVLRPEIVALLGGATLVSVAVRFLRWQYLLRRCGIRQPTRDSLRIYVASLGLAFVPLFAGEIGLRGYLVGAGDRDVERTAWTIALYERVCDLVALCLLAALLGWAPVTGSVVARAWWLFLIPPAAFSTRRGRLVIMRAARILVGLVDRLARGRSAWDEPQRTAELVNGSRTVVAFALSLLAWSTVCVAVVIVAYRTLGGSVGWQAGPLFAAATVLGGFSLAPGGAGVTGLVLGYGLVHFGSQSATAFASVVAIRGLTFWLALGIGQLALLWAAVRRPDQRPHFDAVSVVYEAQLPPHIREMFLDRKVRRMLAALPAARGLHGLDIGCGPGWYLDALGQHGARLVGVDASTSQARLARRNGAAVAAADATVLPFRDGVFDFAYAVNVIHHLPSGAQQCDTLREAGRVLKPGGTFFLHEINVTNPIFRFYAGYIFPLVKRIDEGTESWLQPSALPLVDGLTAESVCFFTFLPDFLPRQLLRWMLPLEARLEASRWARYSAHFMVVFRKHA